MKLTEQSIEMTLHVFDTEIGVTEWALVVRKASPKCWVALRTWVAEGRMPGAFMQALIRNDLAAASQRADAVNARYLSLWGKVIGQLPSGCWGSTSTMADWAEAHKEVRTNV